MAHPTLINQSTRNETIVLSTTSQRIAGLAPTGMRRTQLMIFPLTAGVTVTISKDDGGPAVANAGIVIIANQPYVEATDGGYTCWQGPVDAVASAAGSISIVESWVSNQ